MTESLFDRYFRFLAGQLPVADYGVIAEPMDATTADAAALGSSAAECLC